MCGEESGNIAPLTDSFGKCQNTNGFKEMWPKYPTLLWSQIKKKESSKMRIFSPVDYT